MAETTQFLSIMFCTNPYDMFGFVAVVTRWTFLYPLMEGAQFWPMPTVPWSHATILRPDSGAIAVGMKIMPVL